MLGSCRSGAYMSGRDGTESGGVGPPGSVARKKSRPRQEPDRRVRREPGQARRKPLQGFLLPGKNPGPAVDVEPGVAPAVHDPDDLRAHPSLVQEHPQYLVAEKPLQLLHGEAGGYPEQALGVESAVGGQYMQMRMKALGKVPEGLCGHNGSGFRLRFGHSSLDEGLQGLPPAPAQVGQEPSVPEEEAPENLGYGQHEVTVGHGRENMRQNPLTKGHGPFLMAGRAKVAPFTGECRSRSVPHRSHRILAKPACMSATGEVADHDLLQVGAPELSSASRTARAGTAPVPRSDPVRTGSKG